MKNNASFDSEEDPNFSHNLESYFNFNFFS